MYSDMWPDLPGTWQGALATGNKELSVWSAWHQHYELCSEQYTWHHTHHTRETITFTTEFWASFTGTKQHSQNYIFKRTVP